MSVADVRVSAQKPTTSMPPPSSIPLPRTGVKSHAIGVSKDSSSTATKLPAKKVAKEGRYFVVLTWEGVWCFSPGDNGGDLEFW